MVQSRCITWLLLALGLGACRGRVELDKGPFLHMPDADGNFKLNAGTANKAAYDHVEHFLYVIGHTADVLHVINMTDPSHPTRLFTQRFSRYNQGLPNAVKACRTSSGRGYLAIAFESSGLNEKGHVHFYQLLNSTHLHHSLHEALATVTTDSYDPRALSWAADCRMLVVISEGDAHEVNGVFEDPPGRIEVLTMQIGYIMSKVTIPVSQSKASAAGFRQAFSNCDSGSAANQTSSLLQDLEPKAVHVVDDKAYIIFQENNGVASLDLMSHSSVYHYLGTKDWSQYAFDGSYDDKGIHLKRRTIRSFYQPRDVVSLQVDGKTYLATADTGSIRRLQLSSCRYDESVAASSWRQAFADGMDPEDVTQLKSDMATAAEIGRLLVSKRRTGTDGYDFVYRGYDYVCMFGGRGFSLLDPEDEMRRVFDSGDLFERYFTSPEAQDNDKAVFNANVGDVKAAQTAEKDKRSNMFGPTPSAIVSGSLDNGTQIVVIANGVVGGLYLYTVDPGMAVTFQSHQRRGMAGLTWSEAYSHRDTDDVGEPYITDLLIIDDQNQKTVVAVSSYAGALSFYSVKEV